jgi:hypothetical protein
MISKSCHGRRVSVLEAELLAFLTSTLGGDMLSACSTTQFTLGEKDPGYLI